MHLHRSLVTPTSFTGHTHTTMQGGEEDTSQFDTKFTRMTPIDSPVESKLSESANLNFQVIAMSCLVFPLILGIS